MFGNVTALEGLHVTREYRDKNMQHTCWRPGMRPGIPTVLPILTRVVGSAAENPPVMLLSTCGSIQVMRRGDRAES